VLRPASPEDHGHLHPVSSHTVYELNDFEKSTSPPIPQLIENSKQQVDEFVGELTFQDHLINTLCGIRSRA